MSIGIETNILVTNVEANINKHFFRENALIQKSLSNQR